MGDCHAGSGGKAAGLAERPMGANRLTPWLYPIERKRVFIVKGEEGCAVRRAGGTQGERVGRGSVQGTRHEAGEPGSSLGFSTSWLCDLGQGTALL